jgi:hypothetical protein
MNSKQLLPPLNDLEKRTIKTLNRWRSECASRGDTNGLPRYWVTAARTSLLSRTRNPIKLPRFTHFHTKLVKLIEKDRTVFDIEIFGYSARFGAHHPSRCYAGWIMHFGGNYAEEMYRCFQWSIPSVALLILAANYPNIEAPIFFNLEDRALAQIKRNAKLEA